MLLDAATLRDLEVLSPLTPQGPTVWSLVDRTRTLAGRRALRALLLASLNSEEDILERQRAHQELSEESRTICPAVYRAGCDRVERYLHMAWQLPADMRRPARVIGHLWPRWYVHYLKDARNGRQDVMAFLDSAAELGRHLSSTRARTLQLTGEKIARLVDLRETQELLSLGRKPSTRSLLAFDQLARGHASAGLKALLEHVGTVEAMWSMAESTVEHGWSYPTPGRRLAACGLRHPFLGALGVPNDLQLTEDARVCFVTGPNMAGKSTFLKAVATTMLLAHAGCGVPATSMMFPVVGAIFSSVQIIDNVSGGESFYLAEVRRIKALATVLQNSAATLAIVDEPFRGTNVHDAAEATLAVVTRLAAHSRALVFIASHIAEIAPNISLDPRIRLLHFAASVTTERPTFDYRLRDGVSTQRLGMTLLKQEQVLDLLGETVDVGAVREPSAT
jgi:DNA mismatch repair protein MutS